MSLKDRVKRCKNCNLFIAKQDVECYWCGPSNPSADAVQLHK